MWCVPVKLQDPVSSFPSSFRVLLLRDSSRLLQIETTNRPNGQNDWGDCDDPDDHMETRLKFFETTGAIGTIWTIIWKSGLRKAARTLRPFPSPLREVLALLACSQLSLIVSRCSPLSLRKAHYIQAPAAFGNPVISMVVFYILQPIHNFNPESHSHFASKSRIPALLWRKSRFPKHLFGDPLLMHSFTCTWNTSEGLVNSICHCA